MLGLFLRSKLGFRVLGIGFSLILVPVLVHAAGVEITHVEYDPEGSDKGQEWVRIVNTSGAPLDLTGWKFVEAGVNHNLKALGSAVVPAGAEAIIADDGAAYAATHPGAQVFDSSFSLSNSGEALALADATKTVVATKAYVAEPKAPPPAKASTSKSKSVVKKEIPQIAAPIVAAAPPAADWSLWPWLLGLGALVIVGGGALFLLPKQKSSGYEIIDTTHGH